MADASDGVDESVAEGKRTTLINRLQLWHLSVTDER